jgi:hypothetical protein
MGEMRNEYKIVVGKHEGKNHLEDLDVNGRIILEWILLGGYGLCATGSGWDLWQAVVNKVMNLRAA